MALTELDNFFLATAGAGAALIGLLFVAVSIAPEQIVTRHAPIERQAVAASAFTALFNAFFISLGALIPGSLAWTALTMSFLGLLNSLTLGIHLLRHPKNWQNLLRRVFLILASLFIYGDEFYNALRLILAPSIGNAYVLAVLLLPVYGLGMIRAWELLGAHRFGLLSWLSPLYDVNESIPISDDRQPNAISNPDNSTPLGTRFIASQVRNEHNEP